MLPAYLGVIFRKSLIKELCLANSGAMVNPRSEGLGLAAAHQGTPHNSPVAVGAGVNQDVAGETQEDFDDLEMMASAEQSPEETGSTRPWTFLLQRPLA